MYALGVSHRLALVGEPHYIKAFPRTVRAIPLLVGCLASATMRYARRASQNTGRVLPGLSSLLDSTVAHEAFYVDGYRLKFLRGLRKSKFIRSRLPFPISRR